MTLADEPMKDKTCAVCGDFKLPHQEYCAECKKYRDEHQKQIRNKARIEKWGSLWPKE